MIGIGQDVEHRQGKCVRTLRHHVVDSHSCTDHHWEGMPLGMSSILKNPTYLCGKLGEGMRC